MPDGEVTKIAEAKTVSAILSYFAAWLCDAGEGGIYRVAKCFFRI